MTDSATDLTASPDISALSSEQATELLGKMAAEHRAANPDPFKLTPEASAEQLAALAKTAAAVQADSEGGPALSPYKMLQATQALSEIGFPPSGIERILKGTPFVASDVDWAKQAKREMVGDADFVKRYLAGDAAARHRMTAVDAILGAGAEEK